METKHTTNYSLFSYIDENRVIDKYHVSRLVNSFSKQNLLHVNPIIVDKQMRVLDGQHRLAACKRMEIPIYYTIFEDDCDPTSIFLLQESKKWSLNDYIDFYVKTGTCTDCELFQEHKDKYGISYDALSYVYSLFAFERKRKGFFLNKRLIREGNFSKTSIDVVRLEQALDAYCEFRDFCVKRCIRPKAIYAGTNSILGFCAFFGYYEPNLKRFYTLLNERWFTLKPGHSYREIVNIFVKVYNYKRSECILNFDKFENASFRSNFCLGKQVAQIDLDL